MTLQTIVNATKLLELKEFVDDPHTKVLLGAIWDAFAALPLDGFVHAQKASLWKCKGMWYHLQNKNTDAMTAFEAARDMFERADLASTEDYAEVLHCIGLCHRKSKRWDEAM